MPETAFENDLLTFRTLYDSPMISVRDYVCRIQDHHHSPEEVSDLNSIVLMRHGAFSKHFEKRVVTADVNQATFFTKDSVYRVSHPTDCGDRGTTIVVAPPILTDIIRELDPSVDERPEQPFPFVTGPCSPEIFWRHREFVRRLETAGVSPLEPLWADVTGLQLIADVLEAAFVHSGREIKKRLSTVADHAEKVNAAKSYLSAHLGDNVSLDEVASAVYSSPFNFSRIFQEQTGLPVHRYLTRLRLRASLERVLEKDADLTTIALDLGFSSHSHFSDVFKREFGKTPSEYRNSATSIGVAETSKNLIA